MLDKSLSHLDPEEIARAAALLQGGGLVAFPTETVYGLGACALNEQAVARVFEVKGRPRFDPLIVHCADRHWIPRLAAEWPDTAERLARRFWPGPLTLVVPKTTLVPDLVTAGCPTVALRIPDHPVAQALLRAADVPVAAPSANPFGRISPTTAAHVRDQLGDRIDWILDGGPCRVGVESTVVLLTASGAELLRPGGTTLEEIESEIGPLRIPERTATNDPHTGLASPGNLASHYAPRTPLVLRTGTDALPPAVPFSSGARLGLLAFQEAVVGDRYVQVEVLSPAGDLAQAAARFFAALRRLDAVGLDCIVADVFPDVGLGRALNDRLRRAAHV